MLLLKILSITRVVKKMKSTSALGSLVFVNVAVAFHRKTGRLSHGQMLIFLQYINGQCGQSGYKWGSAISTLVFF